MAVALYPHAVVREIDDGPTESLLEWAKQNRRLFAAPATVHSSPKNNIRAHFGVKCLETRVTAIRQEK